MGKDDSPSTQTKVWKPMMATSPFFNETKRDWRCPFFERIVETIRGHLEMDRSSKSSGERAEVYNLKEGFMPNDRFWIRRVQVNRMTANSDVLYRPRIVNDLVQRVEYLLTCEEERGLMVKGPQGVGKSYSLVNLTRSLLASGKYVVTIIPNCEKWKSMDHFFKVLLESVGVDPGNFGIKYKKKRDNYFEDLIHDIDQLLIDKGMQWVFVFDQINRIFARRRFKKARDVGVLPFPYAMIHQVMKPGRIISIISASANNDVSYKENHPGFEDFEHPVQLDRREIKMLYSSEQVAKWGDWKELEYATGCVPWYLSRWASKGATGYLGEVRNEIKHSWATLEDDLSDRKWKSFVTSAIQCVLKLSSNETEPPLYFDRKYSLLQRGQKKITIVSLFPFVEEVYRGLFWTDMMQYISVQERALLQVCWNDNTTPAVRGQLFEMIVIGRLSPKGLSSKDLKKILRDANVVMRNGYVKAVRKGGVTLKQFAGQSYPAIGPPEENIVLYIPTAPNCPAVDMFLCVGNVVIAFQIHISDKHTDVLPLLQRQVEEAKWKEGGIRTVVLLYLSPEATTTEKLRKRLPKHASAVPLNNSETRTLKRKRTASAVTSTITYVTLFYSIHDFKYLTNILWQPHE